MNEWLANHHGVVSAEALSGFGFPRRDIHRLVERDLLVPVFPGVFRSAHWPRGDEQMMAAVCQRNPNAMIGLLTAAREWSYRRLPKDPNIYVLVPHSCSPKMPGVVVHRCRRIDPVDMVERDDGIRLTSPVRTIFDCADLLGPEATASIIEQIIDRE